MDGRKVTGDNIRIREINSEITLVFQKRNQWTWAKVAAQGMDRKCH